MSAAILRMLELKDLLGCDAANAVNVTKLRTERRACWLGLRVIVRSGFVGGRVGVWMLRRLDRGGLRGFWIS